MATETLSSSRTVEQHDDNNVSRPSKKRSSRAKDSRTNEANEKRSTKSNTSPDTELNDASDGSKLHVHKHKHRSSSHQSTSQHLTAIRTDHAGVVKDTASGESSHQSRRRSSSDKPQKSSSRRKEISSSKGSSSRRSHRSGLEDQSSSHRSGGSSKRHLEETRSSSQNQLQRVAPTAEKSPNRKTKEVDSKEEERARKRRRLICCLGVSLLLLVGIGIGAWQWLKMRREANEDSTAAQAAGSIGPTATLSSQPTQVPSDSPSLHPTQLPSDAPSIGPTMRPSTSPSMVPSRGPTDMPSSTPTQISIYVSNLIFENARFGGQEFNSGNSYQQRAMDWIVQEGEAIVGGSTSLEVEELVLQFYALGCLFFSTDGVSNAMTDIVFANDDLPGWTISSGWLQSAANGGCDWYGIVCNDNGQVEKLSLPENELSGSIPPEIAYLHKSLTYMDLFNNVVHNVGDLGNSFLGELTGLTHLYLGDTYFEYAGIPPAMERLTNLVELDISFNSWFGPLTADPWSKLGNLEYLAMNGHVFNTALPDELVNLPKLQYLYAVESFVQGDLNWMTQMMEIRELWVDGNPFASEVPINIGDLYTLASFSAAGCGLVGTIPVVLGDLGHGMTHLWLNDNSLTGSIPSALGYLTQLETLSLVGNKLLTGSMPPEVCALRGQSLDTLDVDRTSVECDDSCCTCCSDEGFLSV